MKTFLTTMVLASATAFAQQAAPEPTLKAGSPVAIEALASAKWIQGEPLKAFEPGKVYLFECWATWCGPCIAAIPHVNDLHKKYSEKGLRVYGINVWEDGEEKVAKFVKGKGEGMAYPVAYTGKGSEFENQWLKAAGVRGIPNAFIVKDGKLVLMGHPSQLTDSVIESILSGDAGVEKAAGQINSAREAREKNSALMQDFRKATAAGDVATMSAKLEEIEKLDAKSIYLPAFKLDLLIAKKDWPAATKAMEELPAGPARQITLSMTASKIASSPESEFPVEFVKAVASGYSAMVEESKSSTNGYGLVMLSNLQWKSGDKAAAGESAKKAVEIVGKPSTGRQLPAAPFEKYQKSLEEGRLPTMQEFSVWIRNEMPKNAMPAGRVVPKAAAEVEPAAPADAKKD